ncbi:MAG: GNAT family N-acetyltransferase [Anaerolinea sp.]|nr:GNAT family N-acetyltransferase [Anaerolinea sp.]
MTLQLDRIAAFIYAHPHGFPNMVDLPYRLSSWSLDDPDNLRIWEEDGEIQAIGMLQMPWLALDYVCLPSAEHLLPEIFAWTAQRGEALARASAEELPLVIRIPPARAGHIPVVEAHGFQLDDDWTIVHLSRELTAPLSVPDLPEGYAFRTLDGRVEDYVELHQTAFGSKNMRIEWRARSLTMPQYRPDLDLLIVNQDDQAVAFTIGWLHNAVGQIEPLGVHPDYQRLGFGRAILFEGLRRLQANGAQHARIDSYKFNDPALALYQSPTNGSFRPDFEAVGYVRVFGA